MAVRLDADPYERGAQAVIALDELGPEHQDAAEIISEIVGADEFVILLRRGHDRRPMYISVYASGFIWLPRRAYEALGSPGYVVIYVYDRDLLFAPVSEDVGDVSSAFRVRYRERTEAAFLRCPLPLRCLVPEEGVTRLYARPFRDKLLVTVPEAILGERGLVERVIGHELPPGTGIRVEATKRGDRRRERRA